MSTSPVIVITNFFGMHVNAANVGVGLQNPDSSYNVSGTVIGMGQTAQSAVDFALTGSGKLTTGLPGLGILLGGAAALDSYNKINKSMEDGASPAQSDIAGVLGGVAAMAGGAALILGGGVVVPVSVVAGVGLGAWQLVSSAKGWTMDDMGYPVHHDLSEAQKQEVEQALGGLQAQPAFTDAMGNQLGGGTVEPIDTQTLWGNAPVFEPLGGLGRAFNTAANEPQWSRAA